MGQLQEYKAEFHGDSEDKAHRPYPHSCSSNDQISILITLVRLLFTTPR